MDWSPKIVKAGFQEGPIMSEECEVMTPFTQLLIKSFTLGNGDMSLGTDKTLLLLTANVYV